MTPSRSTPVDHRPAHPRGGEGFAGPLDSGPAGLGMRALRAHAQAWLLLAAAVLLLFLNAVAQAATPPSTVITNTATAVYSINGTSVTATGATSITTAAVTPPSIRFLSYLSSATGVPAGMSTLAAVAGSACVQAGGSTVVLAAPSVPGSGTLASPGNYLLAAATAYAGTDVVFIEVTDYSQNLDPLVAETLLVTVSAASGDSETLRLSETGLSTGVFVGYVPLASGTAQAGNCSLQARANDKLMARYVQSSSSVAVSSLALVDPLGLVFDATTGQPIDGARVTLVDAATGQPAQVRGDDGVSTFPSTVVTGSTVTDSGGKAYVLGPGRYQFPRVAAPGTYRLQVVPPQGYRFPSQATDATLQQLPGAPFVLGTTSRGGVFTVLPGPPVQADVPLDPGPLGTVDLSKSAGKAVVAAGDFLPYLITLSTSSTAPLPDVLLADRLPAGFRYQPGSARLNDAVLPDPQVGADGRSLVFRLGTLAAASSSTLRYVASVAPSAAQGPAENTAQTLGRIASNVARATVTVREELNRTRAFLAGQVTVAASCEADEQDAGARRPLKGVRVLLQDGTFVLTDEQGNWHVDNLRQGTHVVQLDTTTLPQGLQLRQCEQASRTGGRDFSQLVNVRGGTLWRADFRLVPVASCMQQQVRREGRRLEVLLGAPVGVESLSATVLLPAGTKAERSSVLLDGHPAQGLQVEDEFVVARLASQPARWSHRLTLQLDGEPSADVRLSVRVQASGAAAQSLAPLVLKAGSADAAQCAPLPLGELPAERKPEPATGTAAATSATEAAPANLIEQLPYDDKWVAAAAPGVEWLHPKAGFTPALPVIKVAVKHAGNQTVQVRVNRVPVDPLRFEGTQLSPSGAVALSMWRSVDLKDGTNLLEVSVLDAAGQVVLSEQREIHYGVNPSQAVLDPARSRLLADGRTPPVVAVRFLDAHGKPVRRGAIGEVSIDAPYLSQQQAEAIRRQPLAGDLGGRARYEIGDDGVALVALQPTSQSGEAVLRFEFGNGRTGEVRAWLQADAREWVLVGFAEGTAGHKALSGNLQALKDAGATEQLFDQNRLAFFAKGQVKGEYLLTAAYDSAKERGTGVSPTLRQAIDPNAFYTLYGDATQQQHDAASIRKLYLKIEKKQFYALFGDFDTGLTVSELGRYSRTVNGLKSEYKGEAFGYNAFATRTSQAYLKDEIQGDGTSGLYRLRAGNVLVNTDKARIEVRDRFQPDRVVATRTLAPWLDYQIDHALGQLWLREPLASRDADLNPQFLVVEYETDGGAGAGWTYGGRVAAPVGPAAQVGVTRLHEGDIGRQGTLTAVDASAKLDAATRAKVEVATSRREGALGPESGNAYLAEVTHDDGRAAVRAYAREQEPGFGLGQQAIAAQGQRKLGADARLKITDTLRLEGEAFRQQELVTGASRQVAEAKALWSATEDVKVSAGARAVTEQDATGTQADTRQLTGGVSYETMERKLVLRASTDLDVGSTSTTANYPSRIVLGADYRLTAQTILTAQQEFARGENLRADTTRVGLRTPLWTGAEVQSSVGNQATPDGGRMFASMGLLQKLRLNEKWSSDFGFEQTHTLRGVANPLGATQPLASGTQPVGSAAPSATASGNGYGLVAGDFMAVTAGLAYRDKAWSGSMRAEWRGSQTETKVNFAAGVQRMLAEGEAVAAGLQLNELRGSTEEARKLTARLSYAHRPSRDRWIWLDRLEYVQESGGAAAQLFTRKLINNFNGNWKPTARTQVAVQYGAKYVREMLQDFRASGFTDLAGLEARYDITERWDIGVHGGVLRAHASGTRSGQAGLSIGYRFATNTWVSVGYNALGFRDADFAGAEYRAKGAYVNLRMKFDQDTFDLNDKAKGQLPPK